MPCGTNAGFNSCNNIASTRCKNLETVGLRLPSETTYTRACCDRKHGTSPSVLTSLEKPLFSGLRSMWNTANSPTRSGSDVCGRNKAMYFFKLSGWPPVKHGRSQCRTPAAFAMKWRDKAKCNQYQRWMQEMCSFRAYNTNIWVERSKCTITMCASVARHASYIKLPTHYLISQSPP